MSRITLSEKRLIVELLDREIYDLCGRLEPDKEWYEGQPAEDRLAEAVSAREKMRRGLVGGINPLRLVVQGTSPRINSKTLREKLQ